MAQDANWFGLEKDPAELEQAIGSVASCMWMESNHKYEN